MAHGPRICCLIATSITQKHWANINYGLQLEIMCPHRFINCAPPYCRLGLGRASLMVQWVRIHCQRRARGFGPRSGRMPHASEGPSPRMTSAAAALPWSPGAVSAEVCAPEPVLRGRGSPGNEEQPPHRNERSPCRATRTQHSPKWPN